MNVVFPAIKEYIEGPAGLDFEAGKFKVYAANLAAAGPVSGAWKVSAVSYFADGAKYYLQITTTQPHGVVAGEQIALLGLEVTSMVQWSGLAASNKGKYLRSNNGNGKKYRSLANGSLGSAAPTFLTTDGEVFVSGSVPLLTEGAVAVDPRNGIYEVASVPSTTTLTTHALFDFANIFTVSYTDAYIANLSKTYLSEFAGSGARVASAALTTKEILPGGVLNCDDFTLDGGAVTRECLVLAKAAALHADTDLADTAQQLVGFYDDVVGLPIPANSGLGDFAISNTTAKLLAL